MVLIRSCMPKILDHLGQEQGGIWRITSVVGRMRRVMERQDPCSNRPVLAVPEPTEIAEIGDADRSPDSVNRPWSTENVYADWLAWRFGNFRSYIWRYFTCRQVPPCHCPVINLRATVLHPDRIFPLSPCRSKMFYFSTLFSLVFMWVILLLQPKHLLTSYP